IGPVTSARKPILTSWARTGAAANSVVAATARVRVLWILRMYVPLLGRNRRAVLDGPFLASGATRNRGRSLGAPLPGLLHFSLCRVTGDCPPIRTAAGVA